MKACLRIDTLAIFIFQYCIREKWVQLSGKNKYLQQSTTRMQYNYRQKTKKTPQKTRTNNNYVRFSKYTNENRPGYGV